MSFTRVGWSLKGCSLSGLRSLPLSIMSGRLEASVSWGEAGRAVYVQAATGGLVHKRGAKGRRVEVGLDEP